MKSRTNNPEAMRGRVLDVAAEAFQSRGYHSTSTHDIVREAGITGGALHHHFPTKKSIALAVIRERVAQAVEDAWIDPVQSARTAAEGIQAAFANITNELDERGRVRGCPLNNLALELSAVDPDFQSAVQNVFDGWRAAITEKLRTDKSAGLTAIADPEETATFVVAAYSGAMALAKASQTSAPLKSCARQLATILRATGANASRARKR
jgi:AcrR family transcriptional regulator